MIGLSNEPREKLGPSRFCCLRRIIPVLVKQWPDFGLDPGSKPGGTVGDWRIVISIGDAVLTVVVIEIDHRSTVYRWRRLFCRPFRSLADF